MAEYKGILNPVPKNRGGYENFSTTEHKIGTWIDGRDIFEKTIDVGTFANSTTKNVNHNISNLDFIINKIANGHTSSGVSITLPYVGSSSGATCDVFANATNVGIVARGGDFSQYSGWVTLQYVKTA